SAGATPTRVATTVTSGRVESDATVCATAGRGPRARARRRRRRIKKPVPHDEVRVAGAPEGRAAAVPLVPEVVAAARSGRSPGSRPSARHGAGAGRAGSAPAFPRGAEWPDGVVARTRAAYSCGYSSGVAPRGRAPDSLFIPAGTGTPEAGRKEP